MSIPREILKEILSDQYETFKSKPLGTDREILGQVLQAMNSPQVIIVTGLRRAGKSTLTRQIAQSLGINQIYALNFEDERLTHFNAKDFTQLHQLLIELYGNRKIFIIDEIQNIQGWELFVRRLSDQGYKFVVTGSNASLLSKEFGTKLTGRYHQVTVFPFSFSEFLSFRKFALPQIWSTQSKAEVLNELSAYIQQGGVPLALEYPNLDVLRELFNDILYRDVIVRYKIASEKTISDLCLYLLDNPATLQQYSKLKQMLHLGSINTVKSYLHYLENGWLFFTLARFSQSTKQQQLAPKKILAIDTGFTRRFTVQFQSKLGRVFENLIFLALRRNTSEISYYVTETGEEIDFYIARERLFIQVCYDLSALDTQARELGALEQALRENSDHRGVIVCFDDLTQNITHNKKIDIIPSFRYLTRT